MKNTKRLEVLFSVASLYDLGETLEVLHAELRSPGEPEKKLDEMHQLPEYMQARERLIRTSSIFWERLVPRHTTRDIYAFVLKLGCKIKILASGWGFTPKEPGYNWLGQFPNSDILQTQTPREVSGDVLVDIKVPRIAEWNISNPNGLVIIPKDPENKYYSFQGVKGYVRYNGTNSKEYKKAIMDKIRPDKK